MTDFRSQISSPGGLNQLFLAGVPVVYHCHHFNLWWDQTVDGILGESEGCRLRTRAARDAFHPLLVGLATRLGADTPEAKASLAEALFPWMGQGRLRMEGVRSPGVPVAATGMSLHYATAWRWKYTAQAQRFHPADAVAAGFLAAVVALVEGGENGAWWAEETACMAQGAEVCRFEATSLSPPEVTPRPVDEGVELPLGGPLADSLMEGEVARISALLSELLSIYEGDDRGLMQAFNVFVTLHLPAYYNRTGYEAIHQIEARAPFQTAASEDLLREAGRVCAFNTFGSILLDAAFEGMLGRPLGNDPLEILAYCCAIARALGFGHWEIAAFEPGRRLVLRVPSDYETAYYLTQYGRSNKPRNYFLQGGAQAMVLLAHEVDWASHPVLTNSMYLRMFKQPGMHWKVTQTRCRAMGDDVSEIVVTKG
jgi:hypothetical protein